MSKKNKEQVITSVIKGMALSNMGNSREEEISCYEQSLSFLSNEKESSEILYYKGLNHFNRLLYSDNERKDEHGRQALEIFRKLSRDDADYERYMVNYCLGVLYTLFNKFFDAVTAFNKAIEVSNNNDQIVWCLSEIAITYRAQGDYSKSEKLYEQIFRITDDNKCYSILYFEMGVMYFNSNNNVKSIDAFNNALRYKNFAPNLVNHKEYIAEIYWYLGTLAYYYNRDFDKAIEHLNKVLENVNENYKYYHDSHITLGHCYLAKENYDIAKEHYNIVHSATSVTEEQKEMVDKCRKKIDKKRNNNRLDK